MPPETLGQFQSRIGNEPVTATAFVQWLEDPVTAIGDQLPDAIECPSCNHPLALNWLQNRLWNPAIFSVSISCAKCAAIIHFDKTPAADRARLSWPATYRR